MSRDRRSFLKLGGLAALAGGGPVLDWLPLRLLSRLEAEARQAASAEEAADYSIRIARGLVELAPDHIISTVTYNGQFPGPLLRMTEGKRVVVEIQNDTDTPEQLHWHGQAVSADVDGAAEEQTPYIPAHGSRRVAFTPGPAGFRFYHTHLRAGDDLDRGQYGGQVGPVYVEPKQHAGAYDREVFLVLKEFEPALSRGGDMPMNFLAPAARIKALEDAGEMSMRASLAKGMPHGYEVGYSLFSINGRMLGHGEPIRVKPGERILFHVLNGSATEIRSLALPGHTFEVVALDGNAVPTPVRVPVLWLGTGERVSAIIDMRHPGVWTMGDLADDDRKRGMGVVVEYAGRKGKPIWLPPRPFHWDYTRFGKSHADPPAPDETIDMLFAKNNAADHGFNVWTINGAASRAATASPSGVSMDKMTPMISLREGRRYRLRLRNASDDIHPVHLHRHSFELTKVAGRPTAGLMKDVVMLGGYQEVEVEFSANNPGLTLFHCHQQLHMDFGFITLFDYI